MNNILSQSDIGNQSAQQTDQQAAISPGRHAKMVNAE